jgi:uncharacterized protein YdaU (DUF1376 family)
MPINGKSPAFQFYAAEYLADENVQLMSLEEEGAYIRLLAYCWRELSIPADEERLSRLCKGASIEVIRVVVKCFNQSPTEPDRLIHPRLEEEREKQRRWRQKSSEGGKKSAEKRGAKAVKSKGGSITLQPPLQGSLNHPCKGGDTLQSSSSASSSKQKEGEPEGKPDPSESGMKFAEWFRSTLPEKINLVENWKENWAEIYDNLIRIDKRTKKEIFAVCTWARNHSFWSANFMSPKKLRERGRDKIKFFDIFSERMKQDEQAIANSKTNGRSPDRNAGTSNSGLGSEYAA